MGPDGIPGWALKGNADILARSILNMQNHAVKLLYLNLGSTQILYQSRRKNLCVI